MQANNIVAEWLSDKAIRTLEPNLSPRIHHGVRWPHAARFQDPYALCQKIHQRFLVQGGLFVKTRVLRLEQKEQGTLLHCADGNTRQFFKAVIAAGVHSDTLLQNTGMTVPLIAERGYHVTFPDQMDLLSHTVGSADRRVVISPLSCGLRVVGISELARPGSPAGIRPPQVLRKQVSALLPSLTQSAVASGTSWMGERPTLPDSLPVIDCHPKDPRLIFAFGHQHLGVTQAAITSEIVGELLCGRQNPEIGHRVSLRRF
jgi:D-amino-acid dehydrogenase